MSHIILIRFGNLCLPDSFTHVVCGSSRSRRSCESNLLQIMRLLLLRLLLLQLDSGELFRQNFSKLLLPKSIYISCLYLDNVEGLKCMLVEKYLVARSGH